MTYIDRIITEEMNKADIDRARKELLPYNSNIFIKVVEKHIRNPQSKQIEKVALSNTKDLEWVVYQLCEHKPQLSEQEFKSLKQYKKGIDTYFDSYPYDSKIGKILRKVYLQLVRLIQAVSPYYKPSYYYPEGDYYKTKEGKLVELSELREGDRVDELNEDDAQKLVTVNPNATYKFYRRKYKKAFLDKIKRGLSIPSKKDVLSVGILHNPSTLLGLVQNLAFEDEETTLLKGIEVENRDLRNLVMSTGQLADIKLLEGAEELERRETEKRVKIIESIEGIKTKELSESEQSAENLIKDASKAYAVRRY